MSIERLSVELPPPVLATHVRLSSGVALNYASQLYGAVLGICVLPFYRRYMGDEGYGLASFFTLVQSYAQLFDFGISATMLRTMALARGDGVTQQYAARVFSSLRAVAWVVASLIAIALLLLSPLIGVDWLNTVHVPLREMAEALALMAPLIGIRWLGGFYRAVLLGAGGQKILATVNIVVSTTRYLGVLPVVAAHPRPIVAFAIFQLAISVSELAALLLLCRRYVRSGIRPLASPIRENRRYLSFIGLTAAISAGVTQTDKLFLSGTLSLADYGRSMLAISLASAISLLAAPMSQALQPRLTTLIAQGRSTEAVDLYRRASKLLWHVLVPVALTLAAFAGDALWCWTGDESLANCTAPVLALYALGNCLMAIAGMPYIFLSAKGNPELDTLGMTIVCIALVPAMYFAAVNAGAVGTGLVWLTAMGVYLLVWSPVMHSAHTKGIGLKWLRDVVITVSVCAAVVWLASVTLPVATNRINALIRLLTGGALASVASILCSKSYTLILISFLRKRRS